MINSGGGICSVVMQNSHVFVDGKALGAFVGAGDPVDIGRLGDFDVDGNLWLCRLQLGIAYHGAQFLRNMQKTFRRNRKKLNFQGSISSSPSTWAKR